MNQIMLYTLYLSLDCQFANTPKKNRCFYILNVDYHSVNRCLWPTELCSIKVAASVVCMTEIQQMFVFYVHFWSGRCV